jgi:hypothetical protein
MERSTVQSCLAAPVLLSKKPYKISINPRFRLAAGFSHFSYFGRNRPGKRVSTDTKLAQRFAFCPLMQTMQPAAFSLRPIRPLRTAEGLFKGPSALEPTASSQSGPLTRRSASHRSPMLTRRLSALASTCFRQALLRSFPGGAKADVNLLSYVIDPAPASADPNDDPSGRR